MSRELILYCDESDSSGRHFANFYGGALVESAHQQEAIDRLQAKKIELNLLGEVKWQKITEAYAQKYIVLIDETFALVREGKLKLRIMFTQNYFSAHRLTAEQRENGFFLLYYQFIKHAFGLRFAGRPDAVAPHVRIYFDKLPDTKEKCAAFKGYVTGLNQNTEFRRAGVQIRPDQLAEIDSKDHVILQALDVVLGAMQFRLNDIVSEEAGEEEKFAKKNLDIKPHRQRMNALDEHSHDIEFNFKDPDHPLQLVFVCAMWLTGFDAPTVSTLYLDKPMQGQPSSTSAV